MSEGSRFVNRLKVHPGKYLSEHRDEYGMKFNGREALTRNRLLMADGATRPAFTA